MSTRPYQYPDDYTGFRYDDPYAPLPPITRESILRALEEGRTARADLSPADRLAGGNPNPYAGKSRTLAEMWSDGYRGIETPEDRERFDEAMRLLAENYPDEEPI